MSILTQKIEDHILPLVTDLGYGIVRVTFIGAAKTKALQIMIERLDGSPVTVEDCEKVSRLVSVSLDVLDPVKSRYNLEVSSPGIDRPLVKPKDFRRFVGSPVVVKTFVLKNEKKVFKGILDSADESSIKLRLEVPSGESDVFAGFDYSEIRCAHLDGIRSLQKTVHYGDHA